MYCKTYPIAPARICSLKSAATSNDLDEFPLPVNPKFNGNASVLCNMSLLQQKIGIKWQRNTLQHVPIIAKNWYQMAKKYSATCPYYSKKLVSDGKEILCNMSLLQQKIGIIWQRNYLQYVPFIEKHWYQMAKKVLNCKANFFLVSFLLFLFYPI